MIDFAKRLTAASFRSREGHLKGATARNMSCRRRAVAQPNHQGWSRLLIEAKMERDVHYELVHDRSGCWFEVRQTATGSRPDVL